MPVKVIKKQNKKKGPLSDVIKRIVTAGRGKEKKIGAKLFGQEGVESRKERRGEERGEGRAQRKRWMTKESDVNTQAVGGQEVLFCTRS